MKMNAYLLPKSVFQVLTLSFALQMSAPASSEARLKPIFDVDAATGFKPVTGALKALSASQSNSKRRQHFCVIGYVGDGDARSVPAKIAWVHWREKQQLVLWEPAAEGFKSKETLLRSRRTLDLDRDVVATDAEVAGSSYVVSRPWVDELINDCKRRGKRYLLSAQ
jgi:hypothetical protein